MLAAVCGASPAETDRLCQRLTDLCQRLTDLCQRRAGLYAPRPIRPDVRGAVMELRPVRNMEAFWADFRPGQFHAVFIALYGSAGFLAARRLRELDRQCRIVLIDSTDRYAVQSYRLHLTDFLVTPVSDRDLERSLRRILTGRAGQQGVL